MGFLRPALATLWAGMHDTLIQQTNKIIKTTTRGLNRLDLLAKGPNHSVVRSLEKCGTMTPSVKHREQIATGF